MNGYAAGFTVKGGDVVHAIKDAGYSLCGVACEYVGEPFDVESAFSCRRCISATSFATPIDSHPAIRAINTAVEEIEAATSLIRRMAEQIDAATNGKCHLCRSGRRSGMWELGPNGPDAPPECSNPACMSHDIRTFILNAER